MRNRIILALLGLSLVIVISGCQAGDDPKPDYAHSKKSAKNTNE